MRFDILQCVVLQRDLPEHGLQQGDVGTVVELCEPDGLEVEFITASGDTRAVVALSVNDVRKATSTDMLTVRTLRPTG